MDDEILLILLGVMVAGFFLSSPFVAWSARNRAKRAEDRITALETRLRQLEVSGLAAIPASEAATVVMEEPEPELVTMAAEAEPILATAATPPPVPPAEPPQDVENRLAQRWLVWLGAVALGIGGLFVAVWAVQEGLLGPTARLGLAVLLGFGLIGLAERIRRQTTSSAMTDFVPSALASGGLVTLYGATLAAHLLYNMLPAPIALVLLALVSAFSVILSLSFLPLLSILGSVGAYLAPLLIDSPEPAAWPLFLYLTAVLLALAAVAGLRRWGWLVLLLVAGSGFWTGLALLESSEHGATAFHLLAMGLTGLALLASTAGQEAPWLPPRATLAQASRLLVLASLLLALLLLPASDHAAAAILCLTVLAAAGTALAAWLDRERWLGAVTAGACLIGAACWHIPAAVTDTLYRDPFIGLEPAIWIAPEAAPLATALILLALAYAATGFLLAWRGRFAGFWASIGAFTPLLALCTGYWRLEGLAISPSYAGMALGLAVLATLAAERIARRDLPTALAAYAIAAVAGVTLALTMVLEEAWLTVALAVQLPVIAWIMLQLGLPVLRRPALAVALIVLARVVQEVTLAGVVPGFWHSLYAYGLPCLAFAAAAWLFARQAPGPLVELLEVGAVLFWLLAITGLLRQLAGAEASGDMFTLPFLVPSMLAWLLSALTLWRLAKAGRVSALCQVISLVLAAGGVLQLLLLLIPVNPVVTGEPVGALPVLNLLLPAYLAPAGIALWCMRRARLPQLGRAAGALALALAWFWLSMEVRHLWQGSVLTGPTSDGEWLAYSVAWLGLAGLLLLTGIRRQDRPLRAAALGVGGLAILKAFVFDMGELEGLYRAGSFLALGGCLIGVGWLYQRYVIAPSAKHG